MENRLFRHCVRRNMPETNSSSSHSITIFGGNIDIGIKELQKYLSLDKKILRIPGGGEYGRNNEDFNNAVDRLRYAAAGIWDNYDSVTINNKTRYNKLLSVLSKTMGVSSVEPMWDDEAKVDNWYEDHPDSEEKNPYVKYNSCPNVVDHESMDKMTEIFEDETTLRDFIFSPNSWVCCGECDVTPPTDLYPKSKEFDGNFVLSIIPDNKLIYSNIIQRFDIPFLSTYPYLRNIICKLSIYTVRSYWSSFYDLDKEEDKELAKSRETYFRYLNAFKDTIGEIGVQNLSCLRLIHKPDQEKLYLTIVSSDVDQEINSYVPILTSESFIYPFRIFFIPNSLFFNEDKLFSNMWGGVSSAEDAKELLLENLIDIVRKEYKESKYVIEYPLTPIYNNKILKEYENI